MDTNRNHDKLTNRKVGLNPHKGTKGKNAARNDRLKQTRLKFTSKKEDVESKKNDDNDKIYLASVKCLPLK